MSYNEGCGQQCAALDDIVPLLSCLGLAGSLLLCRSWRFTFWFPQSHWPRSQIARCYALYSGARAVIRQRGGLVAKQGDPPALASVDVIHAACLVATCSHEFLPTDARRGACPGSLGLLRNAVVSGVRILHSLLAPLSTSLRHASHITLTGAPRLAHSLLSFLSIALSTDCYSIIGTVPPITLEARVCECGFRAYLCACHSSHTTR